MSMVVVVMENVLLCLWGCFVVWLFEVCVGVYVGDILKCIWEMIW